MCVFVYFSNFRSIYLLLITLSIEDYRGYRRSHHLLSLELSEYILRASPTDIRNFAFPLYAFSFNRESDILLWSFELCNFRQLVSESASVFQKS